MQKKIRHDAYGKAVLKRAAGAHFDGSKEARRVNYGGAQNTGGFIDGTAMGVVAIEVESRTSKQVRGAVLDLICHRFEKKLLVLLDVHAHNTKILADQCANAFKRFVSAEDFRVVILSGNGQTPSEDHDAAIVRTAIEELVKGMADRD
ncbi:MAG: hypothetical protein ACP5O6_10565 [Candidatus Baltobacteraceae bacterium]